MAAVCRDVAAVALIQVRGLRTGDHLSTRHQKKRTLAGPLSVVRAAGGRGDFALELPEGWRNDGVVSILEEPMAAGEGLMPFEVKSWRLVKD